MGMNNKLKAGNNDYPLQKLPSLSPSKTQAKPLTTNNVVGPPRRHTSVFEKEHEYISDLTSSAQSHQNAITVKNKMMETIHGARTDHLSPLTRKMNRMARSTLKQYSQCEAMLKLKQDLRSNLLLRMQQKLKFENASTPMDLLKKDQETIK